MTEIEKLEDLYNRNLEIRKDLPLDENGFRMSPFKWEGKPEHMSIYEESKWWESQFEYWREGYFVPETNYYLTGLHYFYMTQMVIKNQKGTKITPWWRDVDEMIILEWYRCKIDLQDLFIFKRRGIGLSVLFGGALPMWQAFVQPGSMYLMTSNDKTKGERMFQEKVVPAYEGLDPWLKGEQKKYVQTGELRFEVNNYDGTSSTNISGIICKQTSDRKADASAFESERAPGAFVDELFLHPFAAEVRQSIQDCLMEDQLKMGPAVFGGSAGIVSQSGIAEAKRIWDDKDNSDVNVVFIDGTWGVDKAPEYDDEGKPTGKVLNFCPNGHSDREGALAWIVKRRLILDKASDKRRLIGYMKSHPLDPDDIFEFNDLGVIPEDLLPRINAQRKRVKEENRPVNNYDVFMQGAGAAAKRNDKGTWRILEHPQEGAEYTAGADPIETVNAAEASSSSEERSKFSVAIRNRTTNTIVAYYLKRSLDTDGVKAELLAGQTYYNNAKMMIERNRGAVMVQAYRNDGHYAMLANQPLIFGVKNYDKKEIKGYHKNGSNVDMIYEAFFKDLRETIENIWFDEILDALPEFTIKNHDLLDAFVSLSIYEQELRRSSKFAEKQVVTKQRRIVDFDKQTGARITKWVEEHVYVDDSGREIQKNAWSR